MWPKNYDSCIACGKSDLPGGERYLHCMRESDSGIIESQDIVRSAWRHAEAGGNDLPLCVTRVTRPVTRVTRPVTRRVTTSEKGLSGGGSGGRSDGGVGDRMKQLFLVWLSEKKTSVFVVGTANNILSLPPELTRKGRLDEIVFVDIPTTDERRVIWRIHLERRQQHFNDADLDKLAEESEGHSGAEIESMVVEALYKLSEDPGDGKLPLDLLLKVVHMTVPLSQARSNEIQAMRQWAAANAFLASEKTTVTDQAIPDVYSKGGLFDGVPDVEL